MQAAAVLAAMAVAEPSSAARLLKDMLAAIGKATQQLASLCSPYGAQRPPLEPPNTVGPGTPRGLGQGAFSDEIKPTINHINGSALGAAALLVAAARYGSQQWFTIPFASPDQMQSQQQILKKLCLFCIWPDLAVMRSFHFCGRWYLLILLKARVGLQPVIVSLSWSSTVLKILYQSFGSK